MGIWTHEYRCQRSNLGIPTQFSLFTLLCETGCLIGWGLASKADGHLVSLGSVLVTLSTLGF